MKPQTRNRLHLAPLATAIPAGLFVLIAAFFQRPIGYWFLGAGGAGLALLGWRDDVLSEPIPGAIVGPGKSAPLRPIPAERLAIVRRVSADALLDLARMAFSAMAGFGLVWAAQISLNLWRDHVSPAEVADAEAAIGTFAAHLKTALSIKHAVVIMLLVIVVAFAFHSWRPVAAVARARKLAAVGLAVLSATSSFTFLAVDRGYDRYEQQIVPIRAVAAHDVERLAATRRDSAALQWVTADWSSALKTQEQQAQFGTDLRALFEGADTQCRALRNAYAHGYAAAQAANSEAGSQLTSDVSSKALQDVCDPAAFDDWIARQLTRVQSRLAQSGVDDELDHLFDNATTLSDQQWTYDLSDQYSEAAQYIFGDVALPDRESLARYAREATRDADDAETARDAIRGIIVESIVAVVGVDLEGPVGRFVEALQNAVATIFAFEVEGTLGRQWAKLNERPRSAFAATPEAKTRDRSAIIVLTPRAVFASDADVQPEVIFRTAFARWGEQTSRPADVAAAQQRGTQDEKVETTRQRDEQSKKSAPDAQPQPRIEPRYEPRPALHGL